MEAGSLAVRKASVGLREAFQPALSRSLAGPCRIRLCGLPKKGEPLPRCHDRRSAQRWFRLQVPCGNVWPVGISLNGIRPPVRGGFARHPRPPPVPAEVGSPLAGGQCWSVRGFPRLAYGLRQPWSGFRRLAALRRLSATTPCLPSQLQPAHPDGNCRRAGPGHQHQGKEWSGPFWNADAKGPESGPSQDDVASPSWHRQWTREGAGDRIRAQELRELGGPTWYQKDRWDVSFPVEGSRFFRPTIWSKSRALSGERQTERSWLKSV